MKIKRVCKECGKEFKTYPAWIRKNRAKFCSKSCYSNWQGKNAIGKNNSHWQGGKPKQTCLVCGKEFLALKSEIKKGWGKFCSCQCHYIWRRRKRIIKNCLFCKKEIWVTSSQIKNGKKFCSFSCRTLWGNLHMRKKDTSIELIMEKELKKRNIFYCKQVPILVARTIIDFLLFNKVAVYVDGEYWHNLPKVKERDIKQDSVLAFYHYKVFRFTETEIKKSVEKCVNKIIKYFKKVGSRNEQIA